MANTIITVILSPVKAEPVVFAGALATLAQAGNQIASTHPSALGWASVGVPLVLAFVARFWTVPWSKIKPIFDTAAAATAQVVPSTKQFDVVIQAAVDDAAARAASTGWPAPITSPAVEAAPVVAEAAPAAEAAPVVAEAAPAPTA